MLSIFGLQKYLILKLSLVIVLTLWQFEPQFLINFSPIEEERVPEIHKTKSNAFGYNFNGSAFSRYIVYSKQHEKPATLF